jgi:hypothetical protein
MSVCTKTAFYLNFVNEAPTSVAVECYRNACIERDYDTNLDSSFWLKNFLVKYMNEKGGSLFNFNSLECKPKMVAEDSIRELEKNMIRQ